ncbi:MAG TPA: SDR family oxidoreductase [Spongiibacteraceae bacterium]
MAPTNNHALKNHRSLIVGGSSGIGYATAKLMVTDGAIVTLAGRGEDKLKAAAAALQPIAQQAGGAVRYAVCDVMQGIDVRRAVEIACADGPLNSAVTVPGGGHYSPVLAYDDDGFSEEVDMNVRPQYLVLKYAGLAMVRSGKGGSIIAISSTAAKFSCRYLASYAAGKAAVNHLVHVAADELGEKNIRVNAVGPGLTRTAVTEPLIGIPGLADSFLELQPIKRLGEADDQAQMIRFLAGPESSWITGQCIEVDGGHTLRSFPVNKDMVKMVVGAAVFDAAERGEIAR